MSSPLSVSTCARWSRCRARMRPKWQRPPAPPSALSTDNPVSEERACGHCGYDPERTWREHDELARRRRRRTLTQDAPEALARLDALPTLTAEPRPGCGRRSSRWAGCPPGSGKQRSARWPARRDARRVPHLRPRHRGPRQADPARCPRPAAQRCHTRGHRPRRLLRGARSRARLGRSPLRLRHVGG
jgi:hypothetical protein